MYTGMVKMGEFLPHLFFDHSAKHRVTREVGMEGKLEGQVRVANVGGTWKDLTDNTRGLRDWNPGPEVG
jgi:hypothetical protein